MKHRSKLITLFAIILICFAQGATYIWTVFQPYVKASYQLSLAGSSLPFTMITALFAVGNLLGGFFQKKFSIRSTIILGNFCMCLGFFITAAAPYDLPILLTFGFGVLGGLGSGLAFNALIVAAHSLFPDKRGLISGITIGSIGVSSAVMNPVCDWLLVNYGYRTAFFTAATIFSLFCLSSFWIKEPPKEESEAAHTSSYSKKFFAVLGAMALIVPPYFLVSPLLKSLGTERNLTESQALLCVVIFSIANILGRFAVPWVSDYISRKRVTQFLYVISAAAIIGLIPAKGLPYVLLTALISMGYGGVSSIFPVLVGEYFGQENQGRNLGIIMLGTSITSFLCPVLLSICSLEFSFLITGFCCLIGLSLTRNF